MIAPYRLPIYSLLAKEFELPILNGGKEANRESWRDPEKVLSSAEAVRRPGLGDTTQENSQHKRLQISIPPHYPGCLPHLLRALRVYPG